MPKRMHVIDDEPAISINDHPKRTRWTEKVMVRARAGWKRVKPDGFGVAQACGAGSFTYGAIIYFGTGLGCLIVGACWFLAAVVIESLGGK